MAPSVPPHPAAVFFGRQLRKLIAEHHIRVVETGESRKLTPQRVHKLLTEMHPELGISQSQVYRSSPIFMKDTFG